MNSKEALKRIRQETAPATYMPDFDKKECCDVIERDLEVLQELKEILLKSHRIENHLINQDEDEVKYEVVDTILPVIYIEGKIKEWLDND